MSLIVLDIDQTVSNNDHRAHLVECATPDWPAFLAPELVIKDTLITGAKKGVNKLIKGNHKIVFLTGRNEGLRDVTKEWILKNLDIKVDHRTLLMRKLDDLRTPSAYKRSQLSRLYYDYGDPSQYIYIDDDLHCLKMAQEFGAVTLKAPECWGVLNVTPTLEAEKFWKR